MTRRLRSTVSEKGQVTIPKPIRERLGIRAGEVLEFDDEHPGGAVVARKAATRSAVDELYGVLRVPGGTDKLIDRLRGEPDAP
jgi:antitoxin PrlF